jgi:hypothetical protein
MVNHPVMQKSLFIDLLSMVLLIFSFCIILSGMTLILSPPKTVPSSDSASMILATLPSHGTEAVAPTTLPIAVPQARPVEKRAAKQTVIPNKRAATPPAITATPSPAAAAGTAPELTAPSSAAVAAASSEETSPAPAAVEPSATIPSSSTDVTPPVAESAIPSATASDAASGD